MAGQVVYRVTNLRLKAGEVLPTTEVPPALLVGRTAATATLVVDDPTADPPTDAAILVAVEASADGGLTWRPVATSWGGTSGVLVAVVPLRDRRIRVGGRADRAGVIDLTVEVA
jgi:hypothetical protein